MKSFLKIICFVLLPILSFISFAIIGEIQFRNEYVNITQPTHHAMSSGLFLSLWFGRGIYSMLLMILFSWILYSKLSKKNKIITLLLLIVFNVPLMFLMFILIPNLIWIVIFLVLNMLLFVPLLYKMQR